MPSEYLNTKLLMSVAVGLLILGCAAGGRAQKDECRQEGPDHLVRSVKVKARWLPPFGSSPFVVADILDANDLLLKLKNDSSLSRYLRSRLTQATLDLINEYHPPAKPKSFLVEAVVKDLNRLLKGPPLFDKLAFAQVTVSAETQRLFAENPQGGEGLFRLNRMLLEDAYPDEIAKDGKMFLPLVRGEPFTSEKLSATRFAVIHAINRQKKQFSAEFINLGKLPLVDVNLVTACGRRVGASTCQKEGLTDKCVDVEIFPYAVSTDPIFLGSILLPIPRSNKFSFLGQVPRPLRLLNPRFALGHDKELAVTPELEVSTDLLTFGEIVTGKPAKARRTSLMFEARAGKSIGERFYNSQAELSFLVRQPSEHVESLGLAASFSADSQPELQSVYLKNAVRLGGHIALNPELGILNRVDLSARYRRSRLRFFGDRSRPEIFTQEDAYEARALLEGRILNGFTRLGLWLDGGRPANNRKFYQRIGGLIGYEKELPIGDETLGIEALFGMGWASDDSPDYALFYGGNSLSGFLYQDANDPALIDLPSGPLIRSFGRNQAGLTAAGRAVGANSHQHFNLSISIPIPGLSRALIPDEVVITNPRKTLRSLINFAVNSGQEALSLNLQDEGLPAEEADKAAAKIFGQIRPGVGFLTNYGKIYALKPMIMFDQARLSGRNSGDAQARYAIGGGLQLTMVVVKFETGYIHSIGSSRRDSRGNLVFRMVFQNLF